MLHFWDASWHLDEKLCPCDIHLMEWIEEQRIEGATVFHFGTGSHHLVGLRNMETGDKNAFVGITASPGEYDAFIKLSIEKPGLLRAYTAYFGDIYVTNGKLLPKFDIVTLFHLCEFRSEKNDSYSALTDEDVVRVFIDQMNPGGTMLFYEGSFAFPSARPIIEKIAAEGLLRADGQFKTLPIYRKV